MPMFADPVSTAKAVKLQPVLGKLHTLKPNRIEAELLSGVTITDEASLRKRQQTPAGHRPAPGLHLPGGDGVFAADRSGQQVQLPATAGGDGATPPAAATPSWRPSPGPISQGTDLTDTAKAGLAASAIAMEGAETINPAMSEDASCGWAVAALSKS